MTEYFKTNLTIPRDTDSNTCPFFIWNGRTMWTNRCQVCQTYVFCGLNYKQETFWVVSPFKDE